MGAKTWMLVYSNGGVANSLKKDSQLDRTKTLELAAKLFFQEKLIPMEDGYLSTACPPDDIICAGYISDVFIVAAKEFGGDYPSKLSSSFINFAHGNTIHLHAMHSAVDWLAFAIWKNKKLERALSLSPDSGTLENIGEKLNFEIPYWNGQHPAIDPEEEEEQYPLPFHPLDLGEEALKNFFGYTLEGTYDSNQIDPESIRLMSFKRPKRSKWKFW